MDSKLFSTRPFFLLNRSLAYLAGLGFLRTTKGSAVWDDGEDGDDNGEEDDDGGN